MNQKHVLVAVSGGIAVYKACDLVSKLSREYDVQVVMTEHACEFVDPLTFAALSHHDVWTSEFHSPDPIPHINLAKWADVIICAPATANTIAKAVYGLADNLMTSMFLAATCPKILCPAMNEHMLENPVTQANLQKAKEQGWIIVDAAYGHLACMDNGKGRLPDTPDLIAAIKKALDQTEAQSASENSGSAAMSQTVTDSSAPSIQKTDEAQPLHRSSENQPIHQTDSETETRSDPLSAARQEKEKTLGPGHHMQRQSLQDYFDRAVEAAEKNSLPGNFEDAKRSNPYFMHSRDSEQSAPVREEPSLANSPDPAVDENERLFDELFAEEKPLKGLTVLVSAGPTQEKMDPVRYITNHSSGKQGYAIAEDARDWGANVILVSGPVSLPKPEGVEFIPVQSAVDMEQAMKKYAPQANFIIMAAAVADYRPKYIADQKIKKSDDSMLVEFVRNPDILKGLGAVKKPGQILCGFAMETENLDANARSKLESKNCDLLIANNLTTAGAGFQGDTNVVSLLKPDSIKHLPMQSKKNLGFTILAQMLEMLKGKKSV